MKPTTACSPLGISLHDSMSPATFLHCCCLHQSHCAPSTVKASGYAIVCCMPAKDISGFCCTTGAVSKLLQCSAAFIVQLQCWRPISVFTVAIDLYIIIIFCKVEEIADYKIISTSAFNARHDAPFHPYDKVAADTSHRIQFNAMQVC